MQDEPPPPPTPLTYMLNNSKLLSYDRQKLNNSKLILSYDRQT